MNAAAPIPIATTERHHHAELVPLDKVRGFDVELADADQVRRNDLHHKGGTLEPVFRRNAVRRAGRDYE